MKITFPTMLIGSLALSGIPPFAGFYSKDLILSMAFQDGMIGHVFWIIGVVTAMMTAFYSFRLIFMVFSGKERFSHDGHHGHAPHESPLVITIPLLCLAALAVVAGWLGERYDVIGYLAQDMTIPHAVGKPELSESALKTISVMAGVIGILIAFVMYGRPSELPQSLSRMFQPFFRFSQNKWYFDELYDLVFVRPTIFLSHLLWVEVDKGVIDTAVNGVASFCRFSGAAMRRIQTGQIQNYALVMALGLFGMVSLYLLMK